MAGVVEGEQRDLRPAEGQSLAAERYVFACGPWLPELFPNTLGSRIFPTRQEVFCFAPPEGADRFGPGRLPTWAEVNGADVCYGFPSLESRGFKLAHDRHGPPMDPDTGDRQITAQGLGEVHANLGRRFPDLAERPLVESRVCQYENRSNGDLLMDVHPAWPEQVLRVGAGSGHGFTHGAAIGRFAADLVTGARPETDPRFTLATKGEVQGREVQGRQGLLSGRITELSFDFVLDRSNDEDWIRIETALREPGATREDLSPEDRRIQELKYVAGMRILEHRLRQLPVGTVKAEELSRFSVGAKGFYTNPSFGEWWDSRDQSEFFASDFIEFFESEFLQ